MPALIAFGRSWKIASDDLTFPAFTMIFIRLLWVLIIIALLIKNGSSFGCSGSGYLSEFLIAMISIQGLILLNLLIIMIISMQGTVTYIHPRRHMSKFLLVRAILFLLEFFCYIMGTISVSDRNLHCKNKSIIWLMIMIITVSWGLFLCLGLFVLLIFNPLENNADGQSIVKAWERRLKVLLCCCFCGFNQDEQSQNAYSDIAELITVFIKDVDLVASDVAVGLILLAMNRKSDQVTAAKPSSAENSLIVRQPDSSFERPAWMNVSMASNFVKYVVGSYGWPMYMFDHFWLGLCHLWPKMQCCSCIRPSSTVIDDNCCMCHMAALKTITGASNEDLIYVSFYNRVFETPFYVVADHETGSIVVVIRGTISQRDVLTDLTAEYQAVQWIDSPEPLSAHRGMHNAAQFVYQKILNLGILEKAFSLHPDYNLVVTGHSLGAGTASILALLLRPHYPDLWCYAFSPPGCLFNEALHNLSKKSIMSIVVGDDFVISITWQSMEYFKCSIVDAVQRSTKPKYQILVGGCWKAFCGSGKKTTEDLNPEEAVANNNLRAPLLQDQVGSVRLYSSEDKSVDNTAADQSFKSLLFPPGSIMHVQRLNEEFTTSWAEPFQFRYPHVSSNMAADHMPDFVMSVLTKMATSSSQVIDV